MVRQRGLAQRATPVDGVDQVIDTGIDGASQFGAPVGGVRREAIQQVHILFDHLSIVRGSELSGRDGQQRATEHRCAVQRDLCQTRHVRSSIRLGQRRLVEDGRTRGRDQPLRPNQDAFDGRPCPRAGSATRSASIVRASCGYATPVQSTG